MITGSWKRGSLATLFGAVALAACSSSDAGGLFDPSPGGQGTGGAAGSGQSGAGGSGMSSGGALGGVGGTLARGGAAGTSSSGGAAGGSGGTAGKTTGGSAGAATTGGASGAGGTATSGGSAGKASGGATSGGATSGGVGAGGATVEGGAAGDGGAGGAGGAGGGPECATGFIGDGVTCVRPVSCAELHRAEPDLPSAAYTLKPASAASEFQAYCEMVAEGGGFTLVLNQGPGFDPSVMGNEKALGFQANGVNRAYSQVLLESDVMLDMADTPISGATYELRAVVSGVHTATRGHTVRELFQSGPHYLERENNSNLVVRTSANRACTDILANDIGALVCSSCNGNGCNAPVLVFGDVDRCDGATPPFAIGGAESYSKAWGNCAGWPQNPNPSLNHFPDNFRVWIR